MNQKDIKSAGNLSQSHSWQSIYVSQIVKTLLIFKIFFGEDSIFYSNLE